MRSLSIVTIGGSVKDVFLVSKQFKTLRTTAVEGGIAECVPLGYKIDVDALHIDTGGGATNAAATFKSLGIKTAIISRVGDDDAGQLILNDLRTRKIETQYLTRVRSGQTGYSTLLTMPQGERSVLVYRGISANFTPADIHWSAIKKSSWIYLTSLGGNLPLSKQIIEFAHKHQVRVAWNPGSGELKKGFRTIKPLLEKVDVLLLNKEESQLLTKVTNPASIFRLLKHPAHIRLITDGARGTHVLANNHIYHVASSGKKATSKTGAGDAFGSGFVAAFAQGKDPITAAKIGTLNAGSVIQHFGAKRGILSHWPTDSALRSVTSKIL